MLDKEKAGLPHQHSLAAYLTVLQKHEPPQLQKKEAALFQTDIMLIVF